jgi:hypothetical protein
MPRCRECHMERGHKMSCSQGESRRNRLTIPATLNDDGTFEVSPAYGSSSSYDSGSSCSSSSDSGSSSSCGGGGE